LLGAHDETLPVVAVCVNNADVRPLAVTTQLSPLPIISLDSRQGTE
jgi:hypothetical protein